jgi:hypothetical protein
MEWQLLLVADSGTAVLYMSACASVVRVNASLLYIILLHADCRAYVYRQPPAETVFARA